MTNFKMLPLAVALTAISVSASAMEELGDESMDAMTGQSGITITSAMQADIDKASYQDGTNSVTAEGIKLRGNGGGDLTQTIAIDVFENSQLAGVNDNNGAAAGGDLLGRVGTGDAIKLTVSDMSADIDLGAVRMGAATLGHAGGSSIGRIEINNLQADDTEVYVYALDGSKGIGIDTKLNQEIDRVVYQDIGYNAATGDTVADDNGTIQIHGIKMSEINLTGTTIELLDGAEAGAINANDTIRISAPAITDGSVDIAAIQVGSSAIGTADGQDEVIGSAQLKGITTVASPVYIYTEDGNEGLRIRQTTNVTVDEVSYISGGLTGFGATAATRDNDGKGSLTLAGVNFQSAASDVKIDVVAGGLSIDSPLTNASLTVNDIQLGGNSMGGLAVSGLNITSNTITIAAH